MFYQVQIFFQKSHVLVQIGVLILLGYAAGWAAKKVSLPRISGYIVAGMLLSLSGLVGKGIVLEKLSLLTDLALGIIAFSIGGALKIERVRKVGWPIFWITIFEASGAFLLVSGALILFFGAAWPGSPLPVEKVTSFAILTGAVCVATAPATVLGVIHEYRSRGPVTTVLLGIVTLDDAMAIILFSIAGGIAGSLMGGDTSIVASALFDPGREIFLSLFIGAAAGLLLKMIMAATKRRGALLGVSLGAIFLVSGMALSLNASPLLACMALGFTLVNLLGQPDLWFDAVEGIEEPIFALFFVIAGAHLELKVLLTAGGMGLVLILSRALGKYAGSSLGACVTSSSAQVKKYIPLGLLSQAGVAIGLVLAAKNVLPDPELSRLMVNAVLASVIFNELAAPPLIRYALARAGEIRKEQED